MRVTAKQIANKLGVSAAAVSMALNNKDGVGDVLRHTIINTAREMGYDFSRIEAKHNPSKSIALVFCYKNFIFDPPFFNELVKNLEFELKKCGYNLITHRIHDDDNLEHEIKVINQLRYAGIFLLGTTLSLHELEPFLTIKEPMVLLDTFFSSIDLNSVTINNTAIAFSATDYLITKQHCQPGYLQSCQQIVNFEERSSGFYQCIRKHHFSPSQSIVHSLSPTIEGAYTDMLKLIDQKAPLASCYFADNDAIAIGAIKAFKERGYQIPDDIAIIGMDNLPISSLIDPSLTTYQIPKNHMASVSVQILLNLIQTHDKNTTRVMINGHLIRRESA